ncbi:O-glucosyltransferase rumi homolog [Morus notabilis]|uniref:O-glucosyltransferase rumi homolog n=1 Tax=Morus notabilis TaxID=981085 RepID=UPI000CED63EB|nr:O-glucosyltransferase rumi homolog [Morus notabilis]
MVMPKKKRNMPRPPPHLLPCVAGLAFLSLAVLVLYKVDDIAAQTKTVAGDNLDPTPWHLFPPKTFSGETRHSRLYKILHCSYLACSHSAYKYNPSVKRRRSDPDSAARKCPEFFRWIHQDLEPWARTGISAGHLEEAREFAAFRAVIVGGRLFVDLYYACVQSRTMFTIWGLLQLLRRYPGMVPDVDMVFDCMDKPSINGTEHGSFPLPLFRYCTTQAHFDIPFPDWSFWGWPETNLNPWDEEFRDIKRGSERTSWTKKHPRAYWKGNPDVDSPVRTELLNCNHSRTWGAQIWRQDWTEEAKGGYEKSRLSNQCNNRYKIYAEGYAWSVSLKYILSCGSLALIISPQYEDFFIRGLIPMKNYWPISSTDLCPSIKYGVEWGNAHPSEAKAIGKGGQEFMESLSMNRVYDYMFHLINEYSKLQTFKPVRPSSALEVCPESLLCHADSKQRKLLEKSTAHPSPNPPCSLQPPDSDIIKSWVQQRRKTIKDIEDMKLKTHTH